MDGSVAVAGETNEVVAVLQVQFSSVFVFEIACFNTSTGFSWDHHGIFAGFHLGGGTPPWKLAAPP